MSDLEHRHDQDHARREGPYGQRVPPRSLPVIEEPLDPANQSLADALRASFRILKLVMLVIAIAFLFSGSFIVNQNEVVVLTELGRFEDVVGPGLRVAWPYPIHQKIRIPTDARTVEIKTFWMNLSKEDENKPLSQIYASRESLQPGVDGALLTAVDPLSQSGGGELVHVKWAVTYRVTDPERFVKNIAGVGDDAWPLNKAESVVRSMMESSSVAMAARYTVDEIAFFNQSVFRAAVGEEAQRRLDAIGSGIRIEQVNAVPYQPLQVRAEFDAVIQAQQKMSTTIETARQEAEKILNEAAGEGHTALAEAILEYEKARLSNAPAATLKPLEERIDLLLGSPEVSGQAASIVQTAKARADQIVQEVRADAETLRELRSKYAESPTLLPARLWQNTAREIFASTGVMRFFLPDGVQDLVIWINRDAEQMRKQKEAELAAPKPK